VHPDDGGVKVLSRVVLPVVVLLSLAGCGAASGSAGESGDDGSNGPGANPWLVDDPDTGAAVVTGEVQGVEVLGFTCDISLVVLASSPDGALPSATVTVTGGSSGIDYREEALTATALGDLDLPDAVPPTLEVSTTQGSWDIGDGGTNTPWTPSVTLTLTEVPVPVDGCPAADVLAEDLLGAESSAQEIVEAFTEVGLTDVSQECPDEWFTWVPPNMSCEEFDAR
jgi:hypothetical protein